MVGHDSRVIGVFSKRKFTGSFVNLWTSVAPSGFSFILRSTFTLAVAALWVAWDDIEEVDAMSVVQMALMGACMAGGNFA